jgi:DinB superfamily
VSLYAVPERAESCAQLDGVDAQWIAGVRGLDPAGLSRPCVPSEVQNGNPADLPLVSLVLHISREVIHHGAEIALLRDLYTPGHLVARCSEHGKPTLDARRIVERDSRRLD